MVLTKQELKEVENTFIRLLRSEIGPLVKSHTGTNFHSYDDKSNSVDLVTALDRQIESLIKSVLSSKYPSYKFIGEETYVKGATKITNEPTFIVDPIDGTTNFIHGYPCSCTSLGLAEMGRSVVGAIFNPHLDQLFHASKGNGAFLNDQDISVTKRPLILQKSLIALEGGSERTEGLQANFEKKMNTYKNLLRESGAFVHGFRSTGSAAMNICYVAGGMLDAYWEGGCWAWDVCAGWCILEEAGGIMVGGIRGEWDIPLNRRCYLAIRGGCDQIEQKQFAESFWTHVAGELRY